MLKGKWSDTQHVLFLDVEAFSEMSIRDQVEAFRKIGCLLNELMKQYRIEAGKHAVFLPTGDGYAICFNSARHDAMEANAVLAFTGDLMRGCRREKLSVRFGISTGLNQAVSDEVNKQQNIIGKAINRAQRVMSAADAGQLLVDEHFHNLIEDGKTDLVFRQLPLVPDKHGHRMALYTGFDRHGLGKNLDPKSVSPEHAVASKIIHAVLCNIIRSCRSHPIIARRRGDRALRLSILRWNNDRELLEVTPFRVDQDGRFLKPSRSSFAREEGCPGQAFESKHPAAVIGLPDYGTSPDYYASTLERLVGLPPRKTHGLAVKARSFFSVPLFRWRHRTHCFGILSLDCSHPLWKSPSRRPQKHRPSPEMERIDAFMEFLECQAMHVMACFDPFLAQED